VREPFDDSNWRLPDSIKASPPKIRIDCAPRVIRTNLKFFERIVGGRLGNPDVASQFDKGELDAWWQDLAAADAAGHFNYGVTVLTVSGRKR
jgi:hypothetical protein